MARAAVLALVLALGACARGAGTPVDSDVTPPQIDAAIDGNNCSVQPCSILPQCGCNGNTACDVDLEDSDGTACRPINANGVETNTCNGANDCDRGYVCLPFGSCKKYCSGDADCSAPRGKCIYTLTSGGNPIPNVPQACSSNCNPVDTTAAGCPSTMKCTMFTATQNMMQIGIADCSPAGSGLQGSDCTAMDGTGVESNCAKGYQCVRITNETAFRCRRICNAPGTTTGCGANNCIGFAPALTIADVSYGVCGP